jgi:dTDP-4-dehydrorhamnose reductase
MSIELWGGPECTVNRTGTTYSDQIKLSGHQDRPTDLDLFASLGIRKLRYPVLWERTAPEGIADWRWPDERLGRLQELEIDPIVGLLHHGSGPQSTSLIDPQFPDKFSRYAWQVAERYPWVKNYTPINEPLTTARFSGLYGHWYPHGLSAGIFAKVMILQCRAIVMAMQEIRKVNPEAALIQTEDLGKTFSVSSLEYQANFENERRWLTFDLLSGRLNRHDVMWKYLTAAGIAEHELFWFHENPCSPDLLGMNHYVTSERLLDARIELYPERVWGGNGRDCYADVEAVRTSLVDDLGPYARLQELWRRYRQPIAVTEVHLDCTPEEQVCWFWEVWNAAAEMKRAGADIKAVTAWALLGSFDWNSLLTRHDGHYESGVFDVTGGRPVPTQLAGFIRDLASGRVRGHAALNTPGWWRRSERVLYAKELAQVEALTHF